jgi:ABC-type dipeptide/oligopeptide/nickel transport system ATPase component
VWKKDFTTAASAGREALSKKFKIVALIGQTGSGKSATANSICGQDMFKESFSTESETD